MIDAEYILSIEKSDLLVFSKELNSDDVAVLVDLLNEKNDKIRYQSFLILQERLTYSDDVYKYWDIFRDKLNSDNSYQRSIGLMMIAGNARWDREGMFEELFDEYCALLNDEKPITIRQYIQSFKDIVPYKPNLNKRIADTLMKLDIMAIKETMRKLIMTDIINILFLIRRTQEIEEIDSFISNALTGGILDNKTKKAMQAML